MWKPDPLGSLKRHKPLVLWKHYQAETDITRTKTTLQQSDTCIKKTCFVILQAGNILKCVIYQVAIKGCTLGDWGAGVRQNRNSDFI